MDQKMCKDSKGRVMQEVIVKFTNLHTKYQWHISCGNWQVRGYGDSLEDAENEAFKAIRGIPNHGVVHTVYEGGKPVDKPSGSFQDALINDGFKK